MRSVLLAIGLFLFQISPTQDPPSIDGVVVQLGTGVPIAGARVSIGPGGQVMADEGGRFRFSNIQPGRYPISTSHNDYIPAQDRRPGMSGTVTLEYGQKLTGVVLSMVAKGAISGRVADRNGNPVANAGVQALKYSYQDGRRILVPVSNAGTNTAGEYRMMRLAPGPYIVRAVLPDSAAPESRLPVYFPGTSDAASASLIDLPPGLDYSGVDLRLSEARAVGVRGRVVSGVTGQVPFGPSITLVPRRGTIATGTTQRAVASDGAFEFRDIAPGAYDIVATSKGAPGTPDQLAASVSIEIGGIDIDSVVLVLQPQISIGGRIHIENLQVDPASLKLSGVRVELRREPYTPELLVLLPHVGADGSFTFGSVTPGDYRLKVSASGLQGYIKSARFGAIDALNPPFPISGPGQFEIVIGLNAGSLDAGIFDDLQKPVSEATVVLVPDAPRRQRFDLYYVDGSDASGRAHFDGLAPGDYRIFAWEDVPADAWQDQDFLRRYEDRSLPIRIREGGRETIDLRLIP